MSAATYDVATDITACGVCKAGEHGRCRGGGCTCQRPFCVRLRPIASPIPVPPAVPIQETPPVAEPVTTPPVELPESGHAAGEHVCSQCGRRFSRPQGLSRHRNETHGIKPAPARPRSKRSTWKARPARKAVAPTPPPSPEAPVVAVPHPAALLEVLVAAPGEWAEVGSVELQTRNVDGRMGVFARFVPVEGAA